MTRNNEHRAEVAGGRPPELLRPPPSVSDVQNVDSPGA
jgi:hypothetical protein